MVRANDARADLSQSFGWNFRSLLFGAAFFHRPYLLSLFCFCVCDIITRSLIRARKRAARVGPGWWVSACGLGSPAIFTCHRALSCHTALSPVRAGCSVQWEQQWRHGLYHHKANQQSGPNYLCPEQSCRLSESLLQSGWKAMSLHHDIRKQRLPTC